MGVVLLRQISAKFPKLEREAKGYSCSLKHQHKQKLLLIQFKGQEICPRLSAKTNMVFHVALALEETFLESKKAKHE